MKKLLPAVVLVLLVPTITLGQDKDNPYKNAKVGDYATYKMSTFGQETTMKQTVKAKDDNEITVETTISFFGKEKTQSQKIDLTKPFDVNTLMQGGKGKGMGKFEKTGDGKEKIKVGDKTYDCTWTAGKMNLEAGGAKISSETKSWVSKTAPLSGLVKMESKMEIGGMEITMTMELSESGNSK
jgi:hypothetical protein